VGKSKEFSLKTKRPEAFALRRFGFLDTRRAAVWPQTRKAAKDGGLNLRPWFAQAHQKAGGFPTPVLARRLDARFYASRSLRQGQAPSVRLRRPCPRARCGMADPRDGGSSKAGKTGQLLPRLLWMAAAS